MDRKQFTFYRSFAAAAARIRDPEAQRQALWAIINYALDGEEPDFDQLPETAAIVVEVAMPVLQASRTRAASGKSGGSAKKKSDTDFASDNCTSKKKNKDKIKDKDKIKNKTKTKNNCANTPEETLAQADGSVCEKDHSFDLFWNAYPVQVDRQSALDIWRHLSPDEPLVSRIMDSLQAWKSSPRWKNEGGRYIPSAAAFLQRGYYHEIPQTAPTIPNGATGGLGSYELDNIRRIMAEVP